MDEKWLTNLNCTTSRNKNEFGESMPGSGRKEARTLTLRKDLRSLRTHKRTNHIKNQYICNTHVRYYSNQVVAYRFQKPVFKDFFSRLESKRHQFDTKRTPHKKRTK